MAVLVVLALVGGLVVAVRQVQDRDDRVEELDAERADLRRDLAGVREELASAQEEIGDLENDVASSERELADMEGVCAEFADAVIVYDNLTRELGLEFTSALEVLSGALVYITAADVAKMEQIAANVDRLSAERSVAGQRAAELGTDCTGVPLTFGIPGSGPLPAPDGEA